VPWYQPKERWLSVRAAEGGHTPGVEVDGRVPSARRAPGHRAVDDHLLSLGRKCEASAIAFLAVVRSGPIPPVARTGSLWAHHRAMLGW